MADPLQTMTAILPKSKWSCLLLHVVLQDAMSEVLKVYPPLKLKVFADDVRLHVWNKNSAKSGLQCKLKDEIPKTKWKLSLKGGGKEGKSKLIASNKYFESKLLELCKDEGIGIADSVGYLRIDIRKQTKRVGKTEKRSLQSFAITKKTKEFRKV